MKLGVYTIEKSLYEGDVEEIIAMTTTGQISILANHIPLISRLIAGALVIKEQDGNEKKIDIGSGFLEVQPENKVVVIIDAL